MKKLSSVFLLVFMLMISQFNVNPIQATSDDGDVSFTKTASVVSGTVNTWDITLEVKNKPKEVKTKADIVLVLDVSRSMEGKKFTSLKNAANAFIDNILNESPESRIALVWFSDGADVLEDFSSNKNTLKSKINGLGLKSYTFLQGGIYKGRLLLNSSSNSNKYMVVMSDGDANISYRIDYNASRDDYVTTEGSRTVWADNVPESFFKYSTSSITGSADSQYISTGYTKPKYYSASNSAIAESRYSKAAGHNIFTIGLETGTQANDTLKKVSTNNQFYTASSADLGAIYAKIANSIKSQITSAKIVDVMGDGFTIYDDNISLINASQGTASFDKVTRTLTWDIGNLSEKDAVDSSLNSAKLTYRVEITDDILNLGLPLDGTFATNKSAILTYKDFSGVTQTKPVASPMVDPTFLFVKKVLHTYDGISVIDDSLEFDVNVHSTDDSYDNDISLVSGETKVYTNLRKLGNYVVSETADPTAYNQLFVVNDSDVAPVSGNVMFNLDETRKDQSIVVHNTETTIPVTSSNKTVRDANDNGYAEPGELLSYTIHVSNDETVPARGIQVKDTLSDLLAHIDAPGANLLTVSIGSETVNKTVQDLMNGFVIRLDPGESADIRFDVKVKSTLNTDVVKKLSNLATVGSDKPTVEIPTGSPKFKATKLVSDANGNTFAEPGERLNYTLSVTNTGNVKANGVSVVDSLGDLLAHIEDPKANVVTIVNNGVTSTATVGALMDGLSLDIAAGKTVVLTFYVDVKASLDVKKTSFLRNIATLGTETPVVDINTGKDDLRAVKTVVDANGNKFAEPGEKLTYTITATNDGNLPAKDVLVQDKLTKLLPHILDPKDNLVTATNDSVVTTFTVKDLITGKSFTIDKNSSLSLTFSVTLKDEVEADLLENDATVRNIPVHTELPYGELTIEALKEVKDGNNNNIAEPGESLTYTLSATNNSGFTAEKVFVKDSLSELLDHIEDPSLVNVSMTNGIVSSTISLNKLMSGFEVDILDGDTLTLKFTLKVLETLDPKETPELTNIATVGEELPPVSIDTGKPELTTSKVVRDANDNGYAEEGEILTYILSVTNNGKVDSEDILVKDDLADLLSYIKDPRLGLVSINEDGLTSSKTVQDLMNGFNVEVAAGATNTYQFSVQVIDDLDFDEVKFLANKAVIGKDEPETEIETATPILSATKTVYDENDDGYAEPGETLLYEIKITNSGKVKQEDLFVQDSFAQLVLYIDDPKDNVVTVTKLDEIEAYTFQELLDGLYLDIEVDETIIMLFSVTIRSDLKFEGIKDLTNIAVVGDQHPVVVIDTGDDDLRATKEVVDENANEFAEPGELLTYTIRAYNDGNVASAETMVRDTLEKLLPHIEDPRAGLVSVVNDGVSSTITVAELMAGKLYVIAAEKELSLTFSVRLKEHVEASLLENKATVGTIEVETELPYGEYKLIANKTVRDANENLLAEPNEELTYILSAQNLSQFAIQDVLIKDSLELLLPYIENPDSVMVTMNLGSETSTFSLKKLMDGFKIDLLSDESMTLEFTVKVLGTLDTKEVRELKNIAIIGEEIPPVTIETGSSKLEVQKYVVDETGDGRAMSSEKLTYFIKINNTGNVDLKDVSIRDTLELIKDYFIDPKTEVLYVNVDGVVHEMFVGDLMLGLSMDIDAQSRIELRFELKLKANLSKDLRVLHNIAEINDLRPEVKINVIHPVDPRTGDPDPTPTVPTKVGPSPTPNKTGQALPQTGVQVDISPYLLILGGLLILLKTIRKKSDL